MWQATSLRTKRKIRLTAAEVARLLDRAVRKCPSPDTLILTKFSTFPSSEPNSIVPCSTSDLASSASIRENSALYIVPLSHENQLEVPHIADDDVLKACSKIAIEFFLEKPRSGPSVSPLAFCHESARIGHNVSIGPYSVVSGSACIGDGTVIGSGVIVGENVVIGRQCLIKSNSVIGEMGFGIVDEGGERLDRLAFLGGVRLGDRVEIGALCTVASGRLTPTMLDDDVKLDDHVHIGHDCHIGARAIITACAEISGHVTIGERARLSPNVSVRNRLNIGSQSRIGIGSVIVKDVADRSTVIGNPARPIDDAKKILAFLRSILAR